MCFPPRGNSPGKAVGAYDHTPLRVPWPGRRISPPSPLKPYPAQIILDDLLKEISDGSNLVGVSAKKNSKSF